MNNLSVSSITLLLLSFFFYCVQSNPAVGLKMVGFVESERYMPKWYQIASLPFGPGKSCSDLFAEYTINDLRKVKNNNSCTLNDKAIICEGKARVADPKINAKLTAKLLSPQEGVYWIIELNDDCPWAMAATPDRENLWVPNRSASISSSLYKSLKRTVLSKHGFNPSLLKRT